MAHHKRKRPINQRACCKMCKYWKINGVRKWKFTPPERRRLQAE